jgi:hypothetical protein
VLGEESKAENGPAAEWLSGRRWCSNDLYATGGSVFERDTFDWAPDRSSEEAMDALFDCAAPDMMDELDDESEGV